jgi:hypothetical protein
LQQESSLFIGTPVHGSSLHIAYVAGALKAMSHFRDRICIQTQIGSLLPRNRDILTAQFLDSGASHFMCIDSDIGWTPEQVQTLLDTGKDFISGTYAKKQSDRGIPAGLTGKRDGMLFEADYVPGGFLLLSRAVIERMLGAYRNMEYVANPFGRIWALWAPLFEEGVTYSGEDVAFCNRWRKIGGEIWMHRGVVLDHYGEFRWRPDENSQATWTNTDQPAVPMSVPSFGEGVTSKMVGKLPVHFHPDASGEVAA